MMLVILVSISALSLAPLAIAQITPMTPGPNETYNADSNCTVAWSTDTSGSWTNITIDLMSGSNDNMSLVTNVASEVDGTDANITPFTWTCPEVDPYSAIYFYQFTNKGEKSTAVWTTRFTIASPSGESIDPPNTQQINGDPVPWGEGRLASSNAQKTLMFSSSTSTAVPDENQQSAGDPGATTLALLPSQTRVAHASSASTGGPSGFTTIQSTPQPTATQAAACSDAMVDSSAWMSVSFPGRFVVASAISSLTYALLV